MRRNGGIVKRAGSGTRLGDALIGAGAGALVFGAPAAAVAADMIVNPLRAYLARKRFNDAYENSARVNRKGLHIPRYSLNRLDGKRPAVFNDEEKALDELYPGWRERNAVRRALLKSRIKALLANPQFVKEHNAVFLPKDADPRVLAHELGHATDNAKKPLSGWERLWFHPNSFRKFLVDPENTPLMTQERNAWDYGGVPEDDELRQAALDTYRESQKSVKRPFKYGLNVAALGALLAGAGVAVNYAGKRLK